MSKAESWGQFMEVNVADSGAAVTGEGRQRGEETPAVVEHHWLPVQPWAAGQSLVKTKFTVLLGPIATWVFFFSVFRI